MSTPCSISARPSTPNLTSFPVASLRTEPAVARRAASALACRRYIVRDEQVDLLPRECNGNLLGASVCRCLFGLNCAYSHGQHRVSPSGLTIRASRGKHASKTLGPEVQACLLLAACCYFLFFGSISYNGNLFLPLYNYDVVRDRLCVWPNWSWSSNRGIVRSAREGGCACRFCLALFRQRRFALIMCFMSHGRSYTLTRIRLDTRTPGVRG